MGVNIGEIVPRKSVEISDLKGKTIAIDAFNVIYQFLSTIRDRETGEPLRDSKGRVTSHLSGLFYRTLKLMKNGIKAVYVFDGEPPEFKKGTIKKRVEARMLAERRLEEARKMGDVERVRLYSQAAVKLNEEHVKEAKKLLDLMGVACVQAKSEGEAQAAYMARKGIVWAAASQDYDSLLFSSPVLVRNLTITGRRKVPRKNVYVEVKPEVIKLEDVLIANDLTREKLIMLGILVGTDYNPGGVRGIGAKKALEMVRKFKSVDDIKKNVEWEFDVDVEEIFNFFMNPPVSDVEVKEGKMDEEKLLDFILDYDFSEERVRKAIREVKAHEEERKQKSLDRWLKRG